MATKLKGLVAVPYLYQNEQDECEMYFLHCLITQQNVRKPYDSTLRTHFITS